MRKDELYEFFGKLETYLNELDIGLSFDGEYLDICSKNGCKLPGYSGIFYPHLDTQNYHEDSIVNLTAEDILNDLIDFASDIDNGYAGIHIGTDIESIEDIDFNYRELANNLWDLYSDFYNKVSSAITAFKNEYLAKNIYNEYIS